MNDELRIDIVEKKDSEWLQELYIKVKENSTFKNITYLDKLHKYKKSGYVKKTNEGFIYLAYPNKHKVTKVIGLKFIIKRFEHMITKKYENMVKNMFLYLPLLLKKVNILIDKLESDNFLIKNYNKFYLYNYSSHDIEFHMIQQYSIKSLTLKLYLLNIFSNIKISPTINYVKALHKNLIILLLQGLYNIVKLAEHDLYHNDLNSTNILIENSKILKKSKIIRGYKLGDYNFEINSNMPYIIFIDYTLMTYKSYRDSNYEIQYIKSDRDKEKAILLDFSHMCLSIYSILLNKKVFGLTIDDSIIVILDKITETTATYLLKTKCSRFNIHINEDSSLENLYVKLYEQYQNIFKYNL